MELVLNLHSQVIFLSLFLKCNLREGLQLEELGLGVSYCKGTVKITFKNGGLSVPVLQELL